MRVLILDQYSEPGGAQRCLMDLLPAMRGAGWELRVAAPGEGSLFEAARAAGAATARIDCGPYTQGRKTTEDALRFVGDQPRLVRQLRALIQQSRPDLVYVNGPRLVIAAALATGRGIPLLFHDHLRLRGATAAMVGLALRLAGGRVIACCRYVAEALEGVMPPGSVKVIYNGVPGPPARVRGGDGGGKRCVGVIGRFGPDKGQEDFVRAARALSGRRDLEFVVCGDTLFGDGAAYRDRVMRLAEGLPMRFLGWRDDVQTVLAGLDLLVVPSRGAEASPRVILEAFATGVPVLAYRVGGIAELVEDGRTGCLVEVGAGKLASAIGELVTDNPERLSRLAGNALQEWRQRFTLERYCREVLEFASGVAGLPSRLRNKIPDTQASPPATARPTGYPNR